ncbi:MAG: hypothetical protein WA231_09555 [Methylocella sp.]
MAIINMPAPGERRKDLPPITIGPRLRRELSARLLEPAFEIDGACPCERASLQDRFAAIADLLCIGRGK